MKIFISWSGEQSQKLAELLEGWIPNVIQTVECFFSSTGIRAGDRWNEEINVQLEHTDFGILCVTPANIGAPWLNYEAGALAKRVTEKSRVVPITMGFAPGTLPAPLRQFNGVTDDEAGFKSLITSIAETAGATLNVDEVFGVWWPVLEPKLAALQGLAEEATPPPPPSTDDVLSEVLGIVQGLQNDVARLRNDGKSTNRATASTIASIARQMIRNPGLHDRIASGDSDAIRNAISHAQLDSSGWVNVDKQSADILRGQLAEARQRLAEESAREAAESGEQIEGEDDAVFPGETIN